MKRILVNATQQEELRVAIVDGQKLCNLDIELPSLRQKKGNIYNGVVASVTPSLDAAFVDYGAQRHGFLPLKEISKTYFHKQTAGTPLRNVTVRNAVREGQELIVQIAREERGTKGASLTTFISLVSRHLVLIPNNPRAHGVSRRIEGREREELSQAVSQIEQRDDEGVIVRTAGIGRDAKELQRDLDDLRGLWREICDKSKSRPTPFLIYQESNIVMQALRDYLRDDIGEVIIDDKTLYEQALEMVRSSDRSKLKLHEDTVPLFSRMQIEGQIESAFEREIPLPSGGSIVIDHTEALTTIDINSARATRAFDIEGTALNTNLEAVEEITLQLRLRDLGGLLVIDFIDMTPLANQRQVENLLREALKQDRAQVQLGRISKFGLLEMSRQRLRPSLGDSSQLTCPRCSGCGYIRTVESCALVVLRLMEEEAMKEKTGRVVAQVPIDINSFLLNEKRGAINEIESRHGVKLTVVPDIQMETPHFKVSRYRDDDSETEDRNSYEMVAERKPKPLHDAHRRATKAEPEPPAVVAPTVSGRVPSRRLAGMLSSFFNLFKYNGPSKKKARFSETVETPTGQQRRRGTRGGRGRGSSSSRTRQRTGTAWRGQREAAQRENQQSGQGGQRSSESIDGSRQSSHKRGLSGAAGRGPEAASRRTSRLAREPGNRRQGAGPRGASQRSRRSGAPAERRSPSSSQSFDAPAGQRSQQPASTPGPAASPSYPPRSQQPASTPGPAASPSYPPRSQQPASTPGPAASPSYPPRSQRPASTPGPAVSPPRSQQPASTPGPTSSPSYPPRSQQPASTPGPAVSPPRSPRSQQPASTPGPAASPPYPPRPQRPASTPGPASSPPYPPRSQRPASTPGPAASSPRPQPPVQQPSQATSAPPTPSTLQQRGVAKTPSRDKPLPTRLSGLTQVETKKEHNRTGE